MAQDKTQDKAQDKAREETREKVQKSTRKSQRGTSPEGGPTRVPKRVPKPRQPAARGDDRRTRILDAAETLFAAGGFDATPTARIAEAAAVPKGLVFYYFPRKVDLLLALLDERLPGTEHLDLDDVVLPGDAAGSLLGLHRRLGMETHQSLVLRTIIFRESGTHAEMRRHLRGLRAGLVQLTEQVLQHAVPGRADEAVRRSAADTFVAVMLDHANARRVGGALPDLEGAARVVALAVAHG